MGQRVQKYFEQADRLGGLVARMRFASLAQLTSAEAAAIEDDADILTRLERALDAVRREFSGAGSSSAVPSGSAAGPSLCLIR